MAIFEQAGADRFKGALLALAVQAAIGYALIVGLGVPVQRIASDGLKLFAVTPPAPPPPPDRPPPPPRVASKQPEGAASPPNLRSKATPVVAPTPVVPLPMPPIIVTAPTPNVGAQATSGAAPVPGPGSGSGGMGNGTGGGRGGNGDGDYTPPRQIGGSFDRAGYPVEAARAGEQGTVSVRFVVAIDGRVPACVVTRSSGSRALDEATCRVIEQRYRFRPSLDPEGRPVRSQVVEDHEWVLRRDQRDEH